MKAGSQIHFPPFTALRKKQKDSGSDSFVPPPPFFSIKIRIWYIHDTLKLQNLGPLFHFNTSKFFFADCCTFFVCRARASYVTTANLPRKRGGGNRWHECTTFFKKKKGKRLFYALGGWGKWECVRPFLRQRRRSRSRGWWLINNPSHTHKGISLAFSRTVCVPKNVVLGGVSSSIQEFAWYIQLFNAL